MTRDYDYQAFFLPFPQVLIFSFYTSSLFAKEKKRLFLLKYIPKNMEYNANITIKYINNGKYFHL